MPRPARQRLCHRPKLTLPPALPTPQRHHDSFQLDQPTRPGEHNTPVKYYPEKFNGPLSQIGNLNYESDSFAENHPVGLICAGFKNKQAKVLFWRYDMWNLPTQYLADNDLTSRLGEAITRAEEIAQRLNSAAKDFATKYLDPTSGKPDSKRRSDLVKSLAAERLYWAKLETPFRHFFEHLAKIDRTNTQGRTDAVADWVINVCQQSADQAFEESVGRLNQSSRTLRAVQRAQRFVTWTNQQTYSTRKGGPSMPEPKTKSPPRLIKELIELNERNDRAQLAKLRRGLGKKPGEQGAIERDAWVVQRLIEPSRAEFERCCLLASLFAVHTSNTNEGSLGRSFRQLIKNPEESESIERRLVALLDSNSDDLPGRLRHAVSLLASQDIPVNWDQLLHDLKHWNHLDRFVQKQWTKDFWGSFASQ